MGILDFANGGNAPGTIVITKGVAGPRNHHYRASRDKALPKILFELSA
jgi:hypothetical protein